MSAGTREVVVGRIGRPHGVRGEVSVEPRTDEPDRRFVPGAVLATEGPGTGASVPGGRPDRLTVRAARWHQDRLLVSFEEVGDRTAAEAVRGLVLLTEVPEDARPDDPEEFYDHQLVGLRVVTTDGREVGEVRAVVHGAAQDLLAVRTDDAGEALVPFVSALVPEVDLAGGRVVVADRPGLLTPFEDED
ncbi:MAG: ribosome maturation factor RimM [Actinomycetes bacterium]